MLSRQPRISLLSPSLHTLNPGRLFIFLPNFHEKNFRYFAIWNVTFCHESPLAYDIGPSDTKMPSLSHGKFYWLNNWAIKLLLYLPEKRLFRRIIPSASALHFENLFEKVQSAMCPRAGNLFIIKKVVYNVFFDIIGSKGVVVDFLSTYKLFCSCADRWHLGTV